MSFVLYALLPCAAPPISLYSFKSMRDARFGRDKRFRSSDEVALLVNRRNIHAEWSDWASDCSDSEVQAVVDDGQEIQRPLGDVAPPCWQSVGCQNYAIFADDPNREHTIADIEATELLVEWPGVVAYNPKQNLIMEPL